MNANNRNWRNGKFLQWATMLIVFCLSVETLHADGKLRRAAETFQISDTKTIEFETIWEKNLNAVSQFKNDADEDEHGAFLIGDIAYFYRVPYNRNAPVLSRFNFINDERLTDIEFSPVIERNVLFLASFVARDDANHVCLVSVNSTKDNDSWTIETPLSNSYILYLSIRCFKDTECTEYVESEAVVEKGSKENTIRFLKNFYVDEIRGDATEDFDVILKGWHSNFDSNKNDEAFWPGEVTLKFVKRQFDSFKGTYFTTGEAADGSTFNSDNKINSAHNYVVVSNLSDTHKLVQGHMMSAPLIVERSENRPGVGSLGAEFYDYYEKVDALMEHAPEFEDGKCTESHFGATAFQLGDETLLLSTLKSYDVSGPKFRLSHWAGELGSFDGLNHLTEFPADGTFAFAESSKYYDYARPIIACYPENNSTNSPQYQPGSQARETRADDAKETASTRILTYVPGSGIGLYRATMSEKGVVANAENIGYGQSAIRLEGNCLKLVNGSVAEMRGPDGGIYSVEGTLIRMFNPTELSNGISITNLHKGVYILRLQDHTFKFCK